MRNSGVLGKLAAGLRTAVVEPRVPWRLTRLGGFSNTVLKVPARRLWMRTALRFDRRSDPQDVTVVIGVRNRSDYRLRNALASLRAQDYPQHLVHITLVDYGSEEEVVPEMRALCAEFAARYRRVDASGPWNRAHCINIGIREATSTYVLSSDVDIVFSRSYLSEAIKELRRNPLQVIYSQSLDLPESTATAYARIAPSDIPVLRDVATPRFADPSAGINVTRTWFYRKIQGYDEAFEGYGGEDDDLRRRFEYLGLRAGSISPRAFYLHQWHPKHEGIESHELAGHLKRNAQHRKRHDTIRRNHGGWGLSR